MSPIHRPSRRQASLVALIVLALFAGPAAGVSSEPQLLREGGLLDGELAVGVRLWFTEQPGTLVHSDGTVDTTATIPLPAEPRWTFGDAGGRFVFSVADPGGETIRATDGRDVELLATVSGASTHAIPLSGALYFLVGSRDAVATAPDAGLWRTDGSSAGTTAVESAPLGNLSFERLVGVGSSLYFTSKGGVWKSGGAPSGTQLFFLATGALDLQVAGERLLIQVWDQALVHYTLWLSNGTPTGTTLLRTHVKPSPTAVVAVETRAVGDRVVWTSFDDTDGSFWLWTSEGTAQLHRFRSAPSCFGTSLGLHCTQLSKLLQPLGDAALFVDEEELWRTDGTSAGTRRIATLSGLPAAAAPLGDAVWLAVADLAGGGIQAQVWSSDGSAAGTSPIAEAAGTPAALTAVDGWLALRTANPGIEPDRMYALTVPCTASSLAPADRARCEVGRLGDVLRCGAGAPFAALALSRPTARRIDRLLARAAMRTHGRGRLLREADRPLRNLLRHIDRLRKKGLDADCAAHLEKTIAVRRALVAALRSRPSPPNGR